MNRFTAFLSHFGISFLIFLGLAYLVVYDWYPDLFFSTDGGWEGMRIIIAVDLVLGPTLTLIVFKKGKPGLKTDLTLIGVLQAVCLVAGVGVVYSERPIAMVYVDGHFYSMSAGDYTQAGLDVPDLSAFPGDSPKWIRVELPEDVVAQSQIRRNAMEAGATLRSLVDRYRPFDDGSIDLSDSYDYEDLEKRDEHVGEIPRWLVQHGGKLADYAFYPLGTRYEYIFVGYSRDNRELLGLLRTPGPI